MKYTVYVGGESVEFTNGITALTWAEIAAGRGKGTLLDIVDEDISDEKLEIVNCPEVVNCPECANYTSRLNESGRLIQTCDALGCEVWGDFYCALGVLNKKEEEEDD